MSAPAPYWASEDGDVVVHLGDCLDVLRTLEADSIDAIVTDPPAGIAFMDREWDDFRRARNPADAGRDNVFGRTSARGPEYGRRDRGQFVDMLTARLAEAYRVLKPGGHALVWSIPRTSHWTAWAVEDAGFDLRDCVLHLFGSGFPKSLNMSVAIDKLKRRDYVLAAIELGLEIPGNNLHDWTKAEHSPGDEWWERFKAHLTPEDWRRLEREVTGHGSSGRTAGMQQLGPSGIKGGDYEITAPATEDAARWEGWGTALKPGQEMWWLARKPLKGTVAAGVLEFGTGALNIGACKVEAVGRPLRESRQAGPAVSTYGDGLNGSRAIGTTDAGRWPANVVFTHSAACDGRCAADCPAGELDRQSGSTPSSARADKGIRHGSIYGGGKGPAGPGGPRGHADSGGVSRFYPVFRYQAKAPASERPRLEDGTAHETVKPLGLMTWLVRLITPPGGTVLDLFAGSGPVAEACIIEGYRCVLIEQDPKSAELIRKRLSKPIQPVMSAG